MRQINKRVQNEGFVRLIIIILGVISFMLSTQFGWGFILGGIVSKENINLKDKNSWRLLLLTTTAMIIVLFILLEKKAVFGYIFSTILYFIIRHFIYYLQER